MKLSLPDVTLVMIDGTCPDLARLSLVDSMTQATFGGVLICSPVDIRNGMLSPQWHKTKPWTSKEATSEFLWYELPDLIHTKFALLTSWDSWVIDASMWSDEFLQYDYVGAPWCYDDGLNVGHGLLRSKRLMKFLGEHRTEFPHRHPEDDVLSRQYRPYLEQHGFRWPSEQVASRFMFELSRPSIVSKHFMFHDSFNFPLVLNSERLEERLYLMRGNKYLKGSSKLKDIEEGRRPEIIPRLSETKPAAAAIGPEAGYDTAEMLLRQGKKEEASELLWQVLRVNPRHADAWALRGMLEEHAGRAANAMIHHGFALQAAPHRHDLWCNRGGAAMAARMWKEAEESFQRSLAIQPSYEAHHNYGNLLSSQMRIDESVEQYKAAVLMNDKANPQTITNLGVALIGQGKWREGFNNYRHRFSAPTFPPAPRLSYRKWHGEPLEGKTILLYVEQGFGDEIMSLRFARAVKPPAARVILAVRPPMYRLARLLKDAFDWVDDVILMYDQPPAEPDYMCALLDVPAFVDITPETVPHRFGYLRAEDRGFRLKFPEGLNVGVCWSSGKRDLQPVVAETARQKSLTFDQLVAPLARPGVNLFSLQQTHGDHARMAALGVRDPMAGVTDFADTAFIIDHLDLVITVDTSVAHLAGAMDKPVWNLVRFDALWPWMQEHERTCWYNSMTLYRQNRPYDWAPPLKRLQADFERLVAGDAGTLFPRAA